MSKRSNVPAKRGPGRPRRKFDTDQVRQLAAHGLNQQQIADALGCNVKTVISRKREYVEFLEAIESGKAEGIASITNALYENALGGNFAAQRFYLARRAPEQWSDRQDPETSGEIRIYIDKDDACL